MGKIDLNNYEAFLLDYAEGNLSEEDICELKNFVLLHPELNIDPDQEYLPSVSAEDDKADFKSDLLRSENDIAGYELIAYVEGELDDAQKSRLEKELNADPDLVKELEMYRKTILEKENLVFEDKKSLQKTEDEFLLNSRSIHYTEGLLDAEEKSAFEKYLDTSESLQQEVRLLKKTILTPDQSVIYPDKSGLKKKARVVVLFGYRTIAAAAALLLLAGLIVLLSKNNGAEKTEPGLADNSKPKNNSSLPAVKDHTAPSVKENTVPVVAGAQPERVKNSSFLAAKTNKKYKKHIAKDTAQVPDENRQLVKKEEEEKKPLPEIVFPEKVSGDSALAVVENEKRDNEDEKKRLDMIPVEEDDDIYEARPERKGFWKRAVSVARQANVLGLKAVNGEEKAKGDYVLSFAGFSVEKK